MEGLDNTYENKKTQSNYMRFGLNKYQKDFNNLKIELQNAANSINELESSNSSLIQNIDNLQKVIHEKTCLIKTLEEEKKNTTMSSFCEKNSLCDTINLLNQENINLSNRNSELALINSNNESSISRLSHQNNQLHEKLKVVNLEMNKLQNAFISLNDKITEYQNENMELKNKLTEKDNLLNKTVKELEIIKKVINSKSN